MSTTTTPHAVQSHGIYHSLPVYPSTPPYKDLTAIITGANGISGNYMLRVLGRDPTRWKKIYCLSRRPPAIPTGLPQNAEHIPCDFLQEKEKIAEVLRERRVENVHHVFFFSYVQVEPKEGRGLWSDAEEMVKVNLALLKNFCEALPLAGIKPKRFMLQTGAKDYGIHLGPTMVPQEEHHPRITLEPNFYYDQEDFLWAFCKEQGIDWNICMPSYILGAVPDAAMNFIYPLGIYAAISRHLSTPLAFPSNLSSWTHPQTLSSSTLNAHLEQWAVLNPAASNQKFNTVDSSSFTWGSFWPKLADWFGVGYTRPEPDDGVDGDGRYGVVTTPYDPPPRGFGPPATLKMRFSLVEWAGRKEVQGAWEEILNKYGLKGAKKLQDVDIERIFSFTDAGLAGAMVDMSMNKARKMGWCGFVDSNECIREVLEEFVELGMLPPVGA